MRYAIELGDGWRTRRATVSALGGREVRLEADGEGRWRVDGDPAPQ